MAEGMLGGILGGEEEKPEVEPPEVLASAEAFASAVAAKLAGNDPGVARKTEEFLKKQPVVRDCNGSRVLLQRTAAVGQHGFDQPKWLPDCSGSHEV